MNDAFEERRAKIYAAKEELKTAGTIHRRDLIKHIRRLESEIRKDNHYHKRG